MICRWDQTVKTGWKKIITNNICSICGCIAFISFILFHKSANLSRPRRSDVSCSAGGTQKHDKPIVLPVDNRAQAGHIRSGFFFLCVCVKERVENNEKNENKWLNSFIFLVSFVSYFLSPFYLFVLHLPKTVAADELYSPLKEEMVDPQPINFPPAGRVYEN